MDTFASRYVCTEYASNACEGDTWQDAGSFTVSEKLHPSSAQESEMGIANSTSLFVDPKLTFIKVVLLERVVKSRHINILFVGGSGIR